MSLEKLINYKFKNKNLLKQCLSHKSYANEHKLPDNERLEFLGDSVLGLVVSKHLYSKFPNYSEGQLSKIKNQIVSKKSLAECSKKFRFYNYLLLGLGELKTKGMEKDSTLSCLYEAILGGIYIDSGIREAEKFVKKTLLDMDLKRFKIFDYKSQIQIFFQKNYGYIPIYKVLSEIGPPHNKKFKVSIEDKKNKLSIGSGKTKKEAQNNAAKKALVKFNQI
jgi:ribonuclease-3|tara:strand:+ start:1037 stop:1699 length:663 start_codon:yes stop_codon:yes gene_type:complete